MSARSSRRRTGRRGAAAATPSPAPTKRTRGGSDAASGAAGGGPEGVGTRTRGACGFAGRALGGSGRRAFGAYFGSIAVVHTPCCWRAWRRFYVFFPSNGWCRALSTPRADSLWCSVSCNLRRSPPEAKSRSRSHSTEAQGACQRPVPVYSGGGCAPYVHAAAACSRSTHKVSCCVFGSRANEGGCPKTRPASNRRPPISGSELRSSWKVH